MFKWFMLDPNQTYRTSAGVMGVMVAGLFRSADVGFLGMTGWLIIVLGTMAFGALHQLAEAWDAAHGEYGPPSAVVGRVGFGFSWRDVVMNGVGALALVLVLLIGRLLLGHH